MNTISCDYKIFLMLWAILQSKDSGLTVNIDHFWWEIDFRWLKLRTWVQSKPLQLAVQVLSVRQIEAATILLKGVFITCFNKWLECVAITETSLAHQVELGRIHFKFRTLIFLRKCKVKPNDIHVVLWDTSSAWSRTPSIWEYGLHLGKDWSRRQLHLKIENVQRSRSSTNCQSVSPAVVEITLKRDRDKCNRRSTPEPCVRYDKVQLPHPAPQSQLQLSLCLNAWNLARGRIYAQAHLPGSWDLGKASLESDCLLDAHETRKAEIVAQRYAPGLSSLLESEVQYLKCRAFWPTDLPVPRNISLVVWRHS